MSRQYSVIYRSIYSHIIAKLQNELSPRFTYHSIDHTLDVLEQTQQIAAREDIHTEENLFLLKVAALYHDSGFLFIYSGHEEKGCELGKKELPGFGLTSLQIKKICGMIMATKIPQLPKNRMEEIICDADLDYLGRDDFEPISNSLYKEFLDFGFVKNHHDWMQKQIGFFELHHYFTKSSQQLRHPQKMSRLAKLKADHLPGNP
jgi:predicted metal-dependent HD superfamily phosphohydrolase